MNKLPGLPTSISNKENKKMFKGKSFWNEELESLWLKCRNNERNYLKFKVNTRNDFLVKKELRLKFKESQRDFDKKFRYFKRRKFKEDCEALETNAKRNPREMWKSIRDLERPPSVKAAIEIVREDMSISRDIQEVLSRWFQDISSLFSGLQDDPEIVYDEGFYQEVVIKKKELERLSGEQQYLPSVFDK